MIIEGTTVSDKDVIKNHFKDFYQSLFTELEARTPFLGGLELKRIESAQATMSEGDFTKGEIWQALDELCGDKSPGLDGFPIRFYRFCWSFMKQAIVRVLQTIASSWFLEWRLDTTFILLIPKHHGGSNVSEFCPITLLFSTINWWQKFWLTV